MSRRMGGKLAGIVLHPDVGRRTREEIACLVRTPSPLGEGAGGRGPHPTQIEYLLSTIPVVYLLSGPFQMNGLFECDLRRSFT